MEVITTLKYVPQLMLNYRLKSVRGFAIGTILLVRLPAVLFRLVS